MATTKLYNNIPIYDASVKSFLNSTGLTGTTEVLAVNKLVKDLKKYGLWSKMKAIYPFVSDTYNLLSYTEDFTNPTWSKTGVTVTANTTTAPNGTTTADTLVFGASSNQIVQSVDNLVVNETYTLTIYLRVASGTATMYWGNIDYTTPSITVTTEWQRFTVTQQAAATTRYPKLVSSSAVTVYAWGAQVNIGSTATTYQPIATTPDARFVSQFKYNLKDPVDMDASFRLAFNGGWTYSKLGATPNGTTGYANTYLVPNTILGPTFSLSYYSNIDVTASSPVACEIGAFQTGLQMIGLSLRRNASADLFGTDGYGLSATSTSTTSNFFGIASRTSTTSLKLWKNTTLIATNTSIDTGSKPTLPIYLALNNGLTGYSTRRCAFSHIGDGLTDTEARDLYTIVQRFQVALNRHVV